ncbi:MAG: hypothetical protein RLZZ381_2971, partial [Cyanobacteriota bacterium]
MVEKLKVKSQKYNLLPTTYYLLPTTFFKDHLVLIGNYYMSRLPDILALDFDGVVCDGLLEYFATTKRAYQQIWSAEVDDSFAPIFYR